MSSLGIDPEYFDVSVEPTDDFFGFVNGKWLKENPIPKEESRWGTFSVLRVRVEQQLKSILDDLLKNSEAPEGSIPRKVRDFYLTAMDTEKCNRLGMAPLADLFQKIDGAKSAEEIATIVPVLHRNGVGAWWIPYVGQDEKNTEMMALHVFQGGIGLPDRDYYLNDDEKSGAIRAGYVSYMREALAKAGMDPEISARIMDIETRLARASDTRVELRDPDRQYNKKAFGEMLELVPALQLQKYFEMFSIPTPEYLIVCQPKFIKEVNDIFLALPLQDHKAYLRWQVVNGMASFLSEDLERLRFDFYNRNFMGADEMKSRSRRVLGVMNTALEDAMGQLYVERHFSAEAKRKVNDLVDHLIAAYVKRIKAVDWMGAETKEKALQKLAAISRKLGYPDKWKDMSTLEVGTESYAANYRVAHAFEFDRQMKKIGGPVDKSEWYMYPQIVNACYQPPMNEILFPAAILQPPFFDPAADDAVNFGGIGSVIGHELTHGFDDEGSKFDANGNLSDWWTADDRKHFDGKADRLAEQFDEYEPLPGLHVNGKLTLGENIADLGGLYVALDGLRLALMEQGDGASTKKIDGFTPEQRFFLSYAVTERGQAREAQLRLQIQVDPHSPSRFRVNGPLSNMPEFYEAFGCMSGDKLFREPDDRVKIW